MEMHEMHSFLVVLFDPPSIDTFVQHCTSSSFFQSLVFFDVLKLEGVAPAAALVPPPLKNAPALENSIEFDALECAICIDQAKAPTCIVARPDANGSCCSHNFCEACITQWVQRPPPGQPANCPTCQREILGLIPNLVARDLLVRLSERKGLLKDREDVIKRLEDRVQQLVQVNADADADINRLRSEADSYKADKERILTKMKEFEDRLQSQQQFLAQERAQLKEDSQRQIQVEQAKVDALRNQLREVRNAALSQPSPIPGAAAPPIVAQSPQSGALSARSIAASWIARTLRSTLSAGSSMISAVLWTPVAPGPLVRPFADFKLQERRGATPTSPVWRACDAQAPAGQSVALKKLHFEGAGVTAFREPFLLFQLEHDNLLRLRALTRPPAAGFAYLIFDFYEADLEYFLSTGAALSHTLIRDLFWRVLQTLRYLHEADVVHLELKPTSLLFPSHRSLNPADLKLASFGNARSLHSSASQTLATSSIQHWPPELLLQEHRSLHHWKAVDIWGAGVLLAQLYMPAFAPVFGGAPVASTLLYNVCMTSESAPPPETVAISATLQNIEAKLRSAKITPQQLSQRLANAPALAIDLLSQMLLFDASRRVSVARAQTHDYFAEVDRKAHKAFARPVNAHELREENILTFLQEQCADLC